MSNTELQPDDKAIAEQLAHPRGELGKMVGERMNQSNAKLTQMMYDNLNVDAYAHVLEIGFANGRLLDHLLPRVARVSGIDISEDMLREASIVQSDAIASGKLDLQLASTATIPFADDTFDAICTGNTLYFWKDPASEIKEVYRVLKPGGRLILGIRTKSKMELAPFTAFGFKLYERADVETLMNSAGLTDLGHQHEDQNEPFDNLVIWGEK